MIGVIQRHPPENLCGEISPETPAIKQHFLCWTLSVGEALPPGTHLWNAGIGPFGLFGTSADLSRLIAGDKFSSMHSLTCSPWRTFEAEAMWGGHPHQPFPMGTLLLICLWNQEMVLGPDRPRVHESHGGHLLGGQGRANILCAVKKCWAEEDFRCGWLWNELCSFLQPPVTETVPGQWIDNLRKRWASVRHHYWHSCWHPPFREHIPGGWRGQGWAPWTGVREDAGLRPPSRISTHSCNSWDPICRGLVSHMDSTEN